MTQPAVISAPLDSPRIRTLKAGDRIYITGTVYTARDAAHKRFMECIDRGKPLPVDLQGQILYYTGPTPAPPGKPIGSAGPTTSERMDAYTPVLLRETGLKCMIGKGNRSTAVVEALKKHTCVYCAAIGGAGALLATCIKKAEVVCYEDLGPEAVFKLDVERFPAVVAIDCNGNNLYVDGPAKFAGNSMENRFNP